MTQQERQKRSREEIYQAALAEFGAHGYEKTTMEGICGQHGISKGMMYHYYSNKDELFLVCVGRTFEELRAYIARDLEDMAGQSPVERIKNFFGRREAFFERHPREKTVFECAMLRPPRHLAEQIHQLHEPLQAMNRRFMESMIDRMTLRPGLTRAKVTRYLESVEYCLKNAVDIYRGQRQKEPDLHAMLEKAGELLDMILFGVVRQDSAGEAALQTDGASAGAAPTGSNQN